MFTLDEILGVTSFLQNIAVISSFVIACFTLRNQINQNRINNAYALINRFHQMAKSEDIELLRQIVLSSYEGTGANSGYFVSFDEQNNIYQNPIWSLFIQEGRGCLIKGKLTTNEEKIRDIELGGVRNLAELLELIAYEIVQGQVEFRIVYYEIGEIINTINRFIEVSSENDNAIKEEDIKRRFKNLRKIQRKYYKHMYQIPTKTFVGTS